jgi:hypothetical protein
MPKPTLEDYYNSLVTGEMRSAKLPWQERFGIAAYNNLRPLADWAQSRETGLQSVAGPLVNWMLEPTLNAARRSAEGEPNVYADFSSESPMNWRLKPEILDPLMLVADVADGPLPVAGAVAGSLRGVKRIPPLYHGRGSFAHGRISSEEDILRNGFSKGASGESQLPGTSVSEDPLWSLRQFSGNPRNPSNVNRVKANIRPEEVWNLPPDLYYDQTQPSGLTDVYKKPALGNNESEWFAKRDVASGGAIPTMHMEPNTTESVNELQKYAEIYDNLENIIKGLKTGSSQPTPKNIVSAMESVRGNRATFNNFVDELAYAFSKGMKYLNTRPGVAGLPYADVAEGLKKTYSPEDLSKISEAALNFENAQIKFSTSPMGSGGKIKSLEEIMEMGIENYPRASPEMRKNARAVDRARQEFFETMRNVTYKTKK